MGSIAKQRMKEKNIAEALKSFIGSEIVLKISIETIVVKTTRVIRIEVADVLVFI
jgi:hypothetical protein